MQNRKPHSQKAPQTGHSIFGTILFSLLAVLAVEFLLLTFAVHVTRLGPQLNQNAEDILAMQVDNRSRYLQSIFHDAQELTSLSDAINGLTQQLLDEGEISLSTLDSSSDAAYPLLEAAAPEESVEYDIRGLTIQRESHKCTLFGRELSLTPIEFSILWYLCSRQGRVVPSEELFEAVWKEKYLQNSNNTVMAHIARLREKMNEPPRNPKFIKTVWGVGYEIE